MKIFYFLPTLFLAIYAEGTALFQSYTRNGGSQIDTILSTATVDSSYKGLDQETIVYCINYSRSDSKTNAFNQIFDSNIFTGQHEFNPGHIYDPLGLAEGRIAGLSITKPGDNPNLKYDARIRGLSNIHGNTMPLIVVDGYLDASLENVDPADIESMIVIKDASATAYYGIRGANGVILISTKKGDGKPQVSYNTYLNVENAMRRQPAMSRDEYLAFSNELDFAQATDLGHDTNWYDKILNTAISQAHNLNISGGNLTTKYYGSMNYRNVDGVLANTGFDRFSARFNVEQKALKDKLTLGLSVAGTLNNSEYGNSDAFRYAPIYNPTAPVRSDNPVYEQFDGYFQQILFNYYNPAAIVDQTDNDGQYSVFNIRIRGDYSITDKLSANASYSLQSASESRSSYYSKYSFGTGYNRNGLASKSYDDTYNQLFEADRKSVV